jgi:hypothetical protein
MGFLKRLLGGGDPPVPEWAAFFSGAQYRRFLDVVTADLRRRGLSPQLGDGFVTADTGGETPTQWGLANLAQLCNQAEESDWEAIVANHFTSLQTMVGRDLDALAADFEQVRPILRVRLMPDESMGGVPVDESVSYAIAPGILGVLVFDFPDSTASVHADHLAGWPVSKDEAFELAAANVRAEPPPAVEALDADGVAISMQIGDSFYVASRALFLDEVLDGAQHAVFAVPNRHVLLWHPVADLDVVKAMLPMYHVALGQFRDGPGSISDQLYWWRSGTIVHLPHRMSGREAAFTPPDEFVAFLETLDEPGSA